MIGAYHKGILNALERELRRTLDEGLTVSKMATKIVVKQQREEI